MSKIKMIRLPTTKGGTLIFEFDVYCSEFLVKNFTDGNIYMSTENGALKENSILIPANASQLVSQNKEEDSIYKSNIVQIIADAASDVGVEVQCIRW